LKCKNNQNPKTFEERRRHKAEIALNYLEEYLQHGVILVIKKDDGNVSKEIVFPSEFVSDNVFNNMWNCDNKYFVIYLKLNGTFFIIFLLIFLHINYFMWNYFFSLNCVICVGFLHSNE